MASSVEVTGRLSPKRPVQAEAVTIRISAADMAAPGSPMIWWVNCSTLASSIAGARVVVMGCPFVMG